ncbi:bactofilin family protein [Dysgonomonas termitidis]
MFNKYRINKGSNGQNPDSRSLSILSGSAELKGEIKIEDDFRIDGNVHGDIYSGGKVVIGIEGCVKGKIVGKSVEVIGKILGDVIVSDVVVLRASCYYEGQITARNIEIEAGASFFGNCRMEEDEILEDAKTSILPMVENE